MNASQILENLGLVESDEINSIVNYADVKIREKFNLNSESIHLWGEYTIGDADENVLLVEAEKNNIGSIEELLTLMTYELNELVKTYEKYYVITLQFGDNYEYVNMSMVGDNYLINDIEKATHYDSKNDAKIILEDIIMPLAFINYWSEVNFSIDKVEYLNSEKL